MDSKRKAKVQDEPEIIAALSEIVRQLQQGIDMHCCLINAIVNKESGFEELEAVVTQCPQRSREASHRSAIKEAIDVLEQSRKAFKSKRLEVLRKHLTDVLIQTT